MKKMIVLFFTLLLLTNAVLAESFKSPDLLVDTQLNSDWSGILVSRIRRLLKNFGVQDPFRQKFDEPIIISQSAIKDYLNPSAVELVSDLGQVIGMDMLNGQTQVTLKGLEYDIRGFKTALKAADEQKDGVSISSDFSASKVKISADKVTLTLMLPGKKISLPLINIDIIKPIIIASEEKLINFFAQLKIKNGQDKYQLILEKADFENMATVLLDQGGIILDFEDIVVPQLSVHAGSRSVKFDSKKIKDLIVSKRDGLKSLLTAQFAAMLKSGLAENMLKAINKAAFNKEYVIDTGDLKTLLQIDSIKADSERNHLVTTLSGDFCVNSKFKEFTKDCIHHKDTQISPSRIGLRNHLESLDLMKNFVDRGDANIVASISEDYVNKILVSTFDAGLWNNMLDKAGVKLGPNKMFFRLDKKNSNNGTLYLDVLYTPKKMERLAVGAKEVRFPLVLNAGLKIKQENQVPVFVIHIAELDTSDEMLLNGRPDLGVVSSIKELRFKKKVLEAIRKETASLANNDVLELHYPELKGLGLDSVDFISDGEGRMNALLLLRDTSGPAIPISED